MTVTPNPTRVGQSTIFNASGSTSCGRLDDHQLLLQLRGWLTGGSVDRAHPESRLSQRQGVVTAVLTVTDSAGRTGTFIVQVTINP